MSRAQIDSCRIDIGIVVDPFPVYVVMCSVTNYHELLAGESLKLANNLRPFRVPTRTCGLNLDLNCRRGYAQQYH
jgi:hypothetical protein